MCQWKSATIRHYAAAAETRDVWHSYPYLLTIDEHPLPLPPEQSSKTNNEYQKIRYTSSASGTFLVGRQQLDAKPMIAPPSPMQGSSIGEKDFAKKQPIDQNSICKPWYSTCFEFILQVQESNNLDETVQLALCQMCQMYQKVKDVDSHTVLYPWIAGDFPHSDSVINHLAAFPTCCSIWKQYAHQFVQSPNRCTYHGKIYLGLTVPP